MFIITNKEYLMQGVDPLVMKYAASGLNREAVNIAVANYGDNPTKVRFFFPPFLIYLFIYYSFNLQPILLIIYRRR